MKDTPLMSHWDCQFRSFHNFRIASCHDLLQVVAHLFQFVIYNLSIVQQPAENFVARLYDAERLSGSLHRSGLRHRPWAATRTLFAWAWPMEKDGHCDMYQSYVSTISLECSQNVKWHAQKNIKKNKGEMAKLRSNLPSQSSQRSPHHHGAAGLKGQSWKMQRPENLGNIAEITWKSLRKIRFRYNVLLQWKYVTIHTIQCM